MWELHNGCRVLVLVLIYCVGWYVYSLGIAYNFFTGLRSYSFFLFFYCFIVFLFVTSVYIDFLNLVLLWVVVGRCWNTIYQLF